SFPVYKAKPVRAVSSRLLRTDSRSAAPAPWLSCARHRSWCCHYQCDRYQSAPPAATPRCKALLPPWATSDSPWHTAHRLPILFPDSPASRAIPGKAFLPAAHRRQAAPAWFADIWPLPAADIFRPSAFRSAENPPLPVASGYRLSATLLPLPAENWEKVQAREHKAAWHPWPRFCGLRVLPPDVQKPRPAQKRPHHRWQWMQ